jgi:hypothetical protein
MGSSILGQVYTKKNSHVYPLQALIYDFEVDFAIKKIKICLKFVFLIVMASLGITFLNFGNFQN